MNSKLKQYIKGNDRLLTLARKIKNYLPDSQYLYKNKITIIGGKAVCLNMIPKGSTIISGGVGNDLEFEKQLILKKRCRVIGFDPTDTAEHFVSKHTQSLKFNKNYSFKKKAISSSSEPIKLYFGDNDFMSSASSGHINVKSENFKLCEAVSFESILAQYKDISYVKLDIEGPEYDIVQNIENINIPQLSIEFHHHCDEKYSLADTLNCINKFIDMDYEVFDYGEFHGRKRKLPRYVSKWSDLNCELLFIKK